MLPFSKIACVQCRHFAIRSFTSAIAAAAPSTSTSTSASNPASTPLSQLSIGDDTAITNSTRSKRRSLHTSEASVDSKAQRSTPPAPTAKKRLSPAARRKETSSTLASLLQQQREYTPPADVPEDVKAREEKLRNVILGLASVGYTKRKKLQIARRKVRELETFRSRRMPPVKKTSIPGIIIEHVEQPQKLKSRPARPPKGMEVAIGASTNSPRGRRKPSSASKETLIKRIDTSKSSHQSSEAVSSGFNKSDTLKATSESGFNVTGENTDSPLAVDAAAFSAAVERLSSQIDGSDRQLKSFFGAYLNPINSAAQKADILEKIKARLAEPSCNLDSGIVDSLEQELENLTSNTEQESTNNEAYRGKMVAPEVKIETVTPLKDAEVATLAHGLQRVLFNPGIHWLQHPRTGLYNFTKAVQVVADRDEFDFERLPRFVRPSQDADLRELLKQSGRKFAGSTSSLTTAMSQVYFALNGRKLLNTQTPSFVDAPREFSAGARIPASIVLRLTDEGTYLVDADKSTDDKPQPDAGILSELGHVLERQLTMEPHQFSRFLKTSSDPFQAHEMRDKREAYHYSATKNLVMRSQLDCHDDRLPRKTFDIKTRATVAIRRDMLNYQNNRGYLISKAEGFLESFEREKYDLIRAAFLKYSMQVRIGNMDGIFLAYHSTGQIFGFEYVSLEDIDKSISGSHEESTQAFHLCVGMLETIFERVTADQPNTTLRLHMQGMHGNLHVFAEARPDLSLASAEKAAQTGEFKDTNDTVAINPEGIRLYTFKIKNFLNGKEVSDEEAVDFVSLAKTMSPSSIEEVSSLSAEEATTSEKPEKKSAFAAFLDKTKEAQAQEEYSKEAARLDPDESNLSKITWSIQYTMSELREQNSVMNALRKLRNHQAMFNKEVLLPEGLPAGLVSSIMRKRAGTKAAKEHEAKAGEEEEGETKVVDAQSDEPQSGTGFNANVNSQDIPSSSAGAAATDAAVARKHDRPAQSLKMGRALLEKWKAYKPRASIRYTTKPFGIIATIRGIAARGRAQLAAAAKANRKNKRF